MNHPVHIIMILFGLTLATIPAVQGEPQSVEIAFASGSPRSEETMRKPRSLSSRMLTAYAIPGCS